MALAGGKTQLLRNPNVEYRMPKEARNPKTGICFRDVGRLRAKIVARALPILTSVVLLLAQGLLAVGPNAGIALPKCERCVCGGACCVRKGQPTPTPAPSAPASTLSVKSWLWAI